MSKFEVCLSFRGSIVVEVEAKDQDDAREKAINEVSKLNNDEFLRELCIQLEDTDVCIMYPEDRNGREIFPSRKVMWHDPERGEIPEPYKVVKVISEEVILIANDHSEAEVPPSEIYVIE